MKIESRFKKNFVDLIVDETESTIFYKDDELMKEGQSIDDFIDGNDPQDIIKFLEENFDFFEDQNDFPTMISDGNVMINVIKK